MTHESNEQITEEEIEILAEVMNIAFGKATADLADVINIYVTLTVPKVLILSGEDLFNFVMQEVVDYPPSISLVKQQFWGEFKGSTYLIFSSGSGKELINLLQEPKVETTDSQSDEDADNEPIAELEKETLLEVGNIIIGACIGKIAELLGDVVTFSPPQVTVEDKNYEKTLQNLSKSEDSAIMLKTVFHFKDQNVKGLLFITTGNDSIGWLKKALNDFMENF